VPATSTAYAVKILSYWAAKVCEKVHISPGMISFLFSSLYKYLLLPKDKHENTRNEERAIGPHEVVVLEENSFRNKTQTLQS